MRCFLRFVIRQHILERVCNRLKIPINSDDVDDDGG